MNSAIAIILSPFGFGLLPSHSVSPFLPLSVAPLPLLYLFLHLQSSVHLFLHFIRHLLSSTTKSSTFASFSTYTFSYSFITSSTPTSFCTTSSSTYASFSTSTFPPFSPLPPNPTPFAPLPPPLSLTSPLLPLSLPLPPYTFCSHFSQLHLYLHLIHIHVLLHQFPPPHPLSATLVF